jgi:hypothetical protein
MNKEYRALQLALLDMDPRKRSDEEIANEWNVSTRIISKTRGTLEYRETIVELQRMAIQAAGQYLGEVQAEALRRLHDLVPKLANAAEQLLQGSPNAGQVNAVNAVIRTLADLGIAKVVIQQTETESAASIMPNLVLADSETSVVRTMRSVKVTSPGS